MNIDDLGVVHLWRFWRIRPQPSGERHKCLKRANNLMFDVPQMCLAVEGFSPEQQALFHAWLEEDNAYQEPTQLSWRIAAYTQADALLLARPMPQKMGDARCVGVPCQVLWPHAELEERESASAAKERFLRMLHELDASMQIACLRYALAGLLVERHQAKERLSGVWHIHSGGILIAVLDFPRLQVSVRPDAQALELDQAAWDHRSVQASAPLSFSHYPLERLMWEYARRSERELLPPRYTSRPISLRRYPRLPLSFLHDPELALLMTLRQRPKICDELVQELGCCPEQVQRMLAALYYCGAITTRPVTWWQHMMERLRSASPGLWRDSTLHTPSLGDSDNPASILIGQTKPGQFT
jgi:hypothetical protein